MGRTLRGIYPDGTVREEGECYVEVMGFHDQPYPHQHRLKWVKCYRPDGTLGSEVVDETGTQTIWLADGTKTWELKLQDSKRVKLTMWHPNGQLKIVINYLDGQRDGPFVRYDAEGRKATEGTYKGEDQVGTWKRYHSDGSIKATETYGDSPGAPGSPGPH